MVRAALAFFACAALSAGARAEETPRQPVLHGASAEPIAAPATDALLVFKGTLLINEFVYRAVLKLPPDAKADRETARLVRRTLATFLADAGYDLAKVRARVKGQQIEVEVDEGALDKIIFVGAGWITALRFRAVLNLPLDVFNRRLFDQQMPRLAKQFGLKGYKFELWPVHVIDNEGAMQLDEVEELRAMPLIRPARGYELRIFAETEQWGSGFSPEVDLGGSIGYGLGGRYRWKDILQDGDRWQTHFRIGGAFRGSVDPAGGGSTFVNSDAYFSGRWLSKPWGGSSRGLRMTISPHLEQWTLQRSDLMLQSYKLGTMEFGSGAGAQLTPQFSLYFTGGLERRWFYDVQGASATLAPDVQAVPHVSNRAFLKVTTQYIFNPEVLRQDMHDHLSLDVSGFRPTMGNDRGFFRFDLRGLHIFNFGWHELRTGVHVSGAAGDVWFVDEIPLEDHLRIGFGLVKYTHRAGSLSLELRYSLLRDKIKVGLFNDTGVWRHLPRDDSAQSPELAGSFGAGAYFFVFDELQIDAYYGAGWSTDSHLNPGFALAIKEAF